MRFSFLSISVFLGVLFGDAQVHASATQSRISVIRREYSKTVIPVGYNEPFTQAGVEFEFASSVPLLKWGSLSLVAKVESLDGTALGDDETMYPQLVSFQDGVSGPNPRWREWVNLDRRCSDVGFYDATEFNRYCPPQSPTSFPTLESFYNRTRFATAPFLSGYQFPRVSDLISQETFGKLPSGPRVIYRARFVVYEKWAALSQRKPFKIRLFVVEKSDADLGGEIKLSLIPVGRRVRSALLEDTTGKGLKRLRKVLSEVDRILSQPSSRIHPLSVMVNGGGIEELDKFADFEEEMFRGLLETAFVVSPGRRAPIAPLGTADNLSIPIFLVETTEGQEGHNAIKAAPYLAGVPSSGIVIPLFNRKGLLGDDVEAEARWVSAISSTIAHEIGHFLGLDHLSESDASASDELRDTPVCRRFQFGGISSSSVLLAVNCRMDTTPFRVSYKKTPRSCEEACSEYDGVKLFCPEAVECEFNHLMWWGAKGFDPKTKQADGNFISTRSGALMNRSPYVR